MLARELVRRGHQVTIVATSFNHVLRVETRLRDGQQSLEETIDGVKFLWIRAPSYLGNSFARIRNMVVFALQIWRGRLLHGLERPDVVVGSSPQLLATLAALRVARRARVPFVLEVRDLWPETLVLLGEVSRRHPTVLALGAIEKHLYRNADQIITLLPMAVDYMVDHGGDRNKITWIPNGVDLSSSPPRLPSDESPAKDCFEVVYSGTHGFANALDSILDAAALLQRGFYPPIRFRFIGDGPAKAKLLARTRDENITNVVFQDAVAKAEVGGLLASADVLIATLKDKPLYRYGTSLNKLNDYLAAGIPVVLGAHGTDNPVSQGDAGIVVPPENAKAMAEAIVRLYGMTPEERAAIGARGRAHVAKHYDMRGLADKYERLLECTLSQPVRRESAELPGAPTV